MDSRYQGNSRGGDRSGPRGRFDGTRGRTGNNWTRPYGQIRPRGDRSYGERSYGERSSFARSNTYAANRARSDYHRTDQNVARQESRVDKDNPNRQKPVVTNENSELHSVLQQISDTLLTLSVRVEAIERNNKGPDSNSAPVTRPKEAVPAGPKSHKTTNNDFASVSRGLYKMVQIGHHTTNWERLPKSIDERLEKLIADIKPPMWDEKFRVELRTLTQSYGEEVRRLVSDHLQQKQAETEVTVGCLDATDIDYAKEVASKHITARLGKRLTDQRRTTLMNVAASKVGLHRHAPPKILPAMNNTSAWTTVNRKNSPAARKPEVCLPVRKRKVSSTGSTPVSNKFEVLDVEPHENSDHDMEPNVSVTPLKATTVRPTPKKTRRVLDAPTPSGVHVFTGEKSEWRIETKKTDISAIVIGDSNLQKVRTIPQYWQFDALPGAKFSHVADVVKHLSGRPKQFTLIIQAGINHRDTFGPADEDDARSMLFEARRNPSVNEIFFNGVSIPADLGSDDADRLNNLNRFMKAELGVDHYIGPLRQLDVNIDVNDHQCIHYNQNTVDLITREIIQHINGTDF